MPRHVALIADRQAGLAVADALGTLGHRISSLDADARTPEALWRLQPDLVFNALSGAAGRDGRLQGVLEWLGLPYTHSGVLASALAADRHQAKMLLRAAGLPVTDHLVLDRAEAAKSHQMAPPYVVKPVIGGLGLSPILIASEREPYPEAILDASWAGADEVMVERFVPGRDLGVAIMGDVALAVSERVSEPEEPAGAGGRNLFTTPARISPNIYEKLQKMSLKAHEVLGCRGVTRTSFRYNDRASGDTGIVCLGVDTQPDLSPGSLLPDQARFAGHSFVDLVAWMVEDASCSR